MDQKPAAQQESGEVEFVSFEEYQDAPRPGELMMDVFQED